MSKSDLYNSQVRRAISEEYVRCSKECNEVHKELVKTQQRLADCEDLLTYHDYIKLQKEETKLLTRYSTLQIELNIWDKAREVCLNVADEA